MIRLGHGKRKRNYLLNGYLSKMEHQIQNMKS